MQHLFLAWEATSESGWGAAGLNIFFHMAVMPGMQPLMLFPIQEQDLRMVDPLRLGRARAAIEFSNPNAEKVLGMIKSTKVALDVPVVHALGNTMEPVHRGRLGGKKNIGRIVFEITDLKSRLPLLDPYDVFVCASEWNGTILRKHVSKPVHVLHEGVDPSLFCPGPKSGLMDPNRFYIFTGGKIEFRKGQDLVLMAFREFSRRHDDAVLVTLWHNPWPKISLGFQGKLDKPLGATADGHLDIQKWMADNGINPARVMNLGMVPNQMLPMVLREMDCALQPSRAEGGTNFIAMEAMACGLPVIIGRNTGMLDIMKDDNCVPLMRQGPVPDAQGWGQEGWGESDVEEILEALETLYTSREKRKQIGAAAAAFMGQRNWAQHTAKLKELVAGLL